VLEVIAQVATALGAAHKAGIVHRDVKPENLMLRTDGYVKVLDFGIAKLLVEAASPADTAGHTDPNRATMPGTILGTTRYMSPEQAIGTAVDARSDVWSLGVVLYELIAGRPPFEGPTPMGTLAMILGREPEPLDRAAPGAPEALCSVVARALRKQPADRFASAAEMASALRDAARELRGEAAHTPVHGEPATLRPEAARSSDVRPTNLPESVSPIVGREREVDEVSGLLRSPRVRLVTLTGPGGTGKTRLALEVARALLAEYRDGVFAVDLSQLADPSLVAAHIGQALRLAEAGGTPMGELLARHLRERELLLLLDSFEHLLAAAPLVSELLGSAPGLKVLATSRAPLHLRQEREVAVEPLEVPAFSTLPPLEELARSGAVALFVERAREAKPSFGLTAENARAVVEICRRLEGLPLAIELAAARVKLFAPRALLGKLEHRLKLLTGGARDLPERQQTMRGAVSWSYDLLDAGERELLCRLAVFAGGCDYEAAEAVCGEGAGRQGSGAGQGGSRAAPAGGSGWPPTSGPQLSTCSKDSGRWSTRACFGSGSRRTARRGSGCWTWCGSSRSSSWRRTGGRRRRAASTLATSCAWRRRRCRRCAVPSRRRPWGGSPASTRTWGRRNRIWSSARRRRSSASRWCSRPTGTLAATSRRPSAGWSERSRPGPRRRPHARGSCSNAR
jgi:non-specific serine/threonine protein kinase